jgi:hypothetical protein
MNIKNYTTEVPAARSIGYIEEILLSQGCKNILKEYNDQQRITSLSFLLPVRDMVLPFRLVPETKACYVWLKKKYPKQNDATLLARAERIVWKQLHEWLALQISMIELQQLEKLQALFPYLWDASSNQTFYESERQKEFKNLLPYSK